MQQKFGHVVNELEQEQQALAIKGMVATAAAASAVAAENRSTEQKRQDAKKRV